MTTSSPVRLRQCATHLALLLGAPIVLGLTARATPSASAHAREIVPLAFARGGIDAGQVIDLMASNVRVAALPLLGSVALVALQRQPRTWRQLRALLDVLIGLSLTGNAIVLAVAVAGYGPLRL